MTDLLALLNEWADREHHRGKGFIRDGIIDIERWNRAPRKVLLLLKEAYGDTENPVDWDLCRAIRDEWKGPKYKIWHTAASWCFVAQNRVTHLPAFPSTMEAYAAVAEALLSSAVINIKKSGGRSRSDDDDLRFYVMHDKDLIKKEIDLISPEIVICGNTWWAVKSLWPDLEVHQAYDLVWKIGSVPFIDFWHPANQFPNELNYYALGCLIQNGA